MASNDDITILLPLHRAPFYFAPAFLTSVADWQSEFGKLLNDVFKSYPCSITYPYVDFRAASVHFDELVFKIDAHVGTFSLDEGKEEDDWDEFCIYGTPDEFFSQLAKASAPLRLIEEFSKVSRCVDTLFARMKSRLDRALADKHAEILGRVGRLFADPSIIDRNQFALLRVVPRTDEVWISGDDWRLDEAIGPDGERVFSLGVTPVGASVGIASTALADETRGSLGRSRTYNHEAVLAEGDRLFEENSKLSPDDPEWCRRAQLVKALQDFCERTYGQVPAKSTAQRLAKMVLKKHQPELADN